MVEQGEFPPWTLKGEEQEKLQPFLGTGHFVVSSIFECLMFHPKSEQYRIWDSWRDNKSLMDRVTAVGEFVAYALRKTGSMRGWVPTDVLRLWDEAENKRKKDKKLDPNQASLFEGFSRQICRYYQVAGRSQNPRWRSSTEVKLVIGDPTRICFSHPCDLEFEDCKECETVVLEMETMMDETKSKENLERNVDCVGDGLNDDRTPESQAPVAPPKSCECKELRAEIAELRKLIVRQQTETVTAIDDSHNELKRILVSDIRVLVETMSHTLGNFIASDSRLKMEGIAPAVDLVRGTIVNPGIATAPTQAKSLAELFSR